MPILQCGDDTIVFIHIPKTGGATIEHALRKFGTLDYFEWKTRAHPSWQRYGHSPQHCTLRELRELGVTCDASTRTFAVVRHPVDRVVSEFNRMTYLGWLKREMSVDDFLDQFLDLSEQALRRWDRHQLTCAEYLVDDSGNLSPDVHVIHYKRDGLLEEVSEFLFPKDGDAHASFCDVANAGPGSGILSAEDLTAAQRERIEAFFARDMELFFTSPPICKPKVVDGCASHV